MNRYKANVLWAMILFGIVFVLSFYLTSCYHPAGSTEPIPEPPTPIAEPTPEPVVTEPSPVFDIAKEAAQYRSRYPVTNVDQKITDNRGKGDGRLDGTRNMRTVLYGVYYRGGANNVYDTEDPRPNQNPLPVKGLVNLCREGFGAAIYLYPNNFKIAPDSLFCTDFAEQDRRMTYLNLLAYSSGKPEEILHLIHDRIKGKVAGPIYGHCWNGWHASGMIAAMALMQFCDYNVEKALAYWIRNTDGNSSGYESTKKLIRNFKKIPALSITPAEKAAICL